MSTTSRAEPPPCPEKAVEVALNEFTALRAEIVSRRSTQSAIVGVGLTAIGVVFGVVFKDDGDRSLLLVIPPLALIAGLLHLSETYMIHGLGSHIKDRVWPFLMSQTGYPHSWEAQGAGETTGAKAAAPIVLFSGPAPILFVVLGAVALWQANVRPWVAWLEGILLALTFVVAVLIIWRYKREARGQ